MGLHISWGHPSPKPAAAVTQWPYTSLAATNYLDRYDAGEYLESVMVSVETPFSAGVTATVGFPGDVSGVMASSDLDLQTAGVYEATVCRTFSATQTLNLYVSGTPTSGKLVTFVVSS